MRAPIKSLPPHIDRWVVRIGWLRSLDALAAWLTLWAGLSLVLPAFDGSGQAAVAAMVVAVGIAISPVRGLWRPVTGWVGLTVSGALRPGDRAWLVRRGGADLVIVTARRGLRMVVAQAQESAEGITVRRTRVLVIPAGRSDR
jgi:hypothetical protein